MCDLLLVITECKLYFVKTKTNTLQNAEAPSINFLKGNCTCLQSCPHLTEPSEKHNDLMQQLFMFEGCGSALALQKLI